MIVYIITIHIGYRLLTVFVFFGFVLVCVDNICVVFFNDFELLKSEIEMRKKSLNLISYYRLINVG